MAEVPGSILGDEWIFFFLLEKKKFSDNEKISKCRKNGIDRLRNGYLLRFLARREVSKSSNMIYFIQGFKIIDLLSQLKRNTFIFKYFSVLN